MYPDYLNRSLPLEVLRMQMVSTKAGPRVAPNCLEVQVSSPQVACAEVLLPVFLEEQKHQKRDNIILRDREMEARIICGKHSLRVYSHVSDI